MHPRYQNPEVTRLWSESETYRQWLTIGRAVVLVQTERGAIPAKEGNAILAGVAPVDLEASDLTDIRAYERETQHDVAAFLKWWRVNLPEGLARWTHFGLTSSDLVDTALGMRFAELELPYWQAVGAVEQQAHRIMANHAQTPVLGHTHGQPAEPTTLGIRAQQWYGMLNRASSRLSVAWSQMRLAKLSGPVGTYAHNDPEVERLVAYQLGLEPHGPGASQVVPRDRLAHWASCAAGLVQVLAKVGVDFRLMAARGEVVEGWPEGRVGSSAMPHKRNPVTAEKLSGLARLAAGYASMLQPVDLWDERDISHSSVERVAVPDLLHVLMHALESAASLLRDATWQDRAMRENLSRAGALPYSAWYALKLQRDHAFPPDAARAGALRWVEHYHPATDGTPPPSPLDMVRNHPLGRRATDEQLPVASLFDPGLTPEQPS